MTSNASKACICNPSTSSSITPLPPLYTPSLPAPLYSDIPSSGEQSLQHTPLVGGSWLLPQSTFLRRLGKISVLLHNQEEDVQIPVYRQSGIVSGSVELEDPERVLEVSVLIEGVLDLSINVGTNNTIKTLHFTSTLWKKQHEHSQGAIPPMCPSQLAFAFSLPREYQDGSETHPLPPSFRTPDDFEASGLFARSSFRLRVTVTRTPKSRFGLWENMKHVFIPFEYRPRTRSQHPMVASNGCLALIKRLPDEWYQSTSSIDVPNPLEENVSFEPVTANILVPNPRVYAISDTIPFHLQISGRVDSLRALVAPHTLDEIVSPNSCSSPSSDSPTFLPYSSKSLPQRTCIKKLQVEMGTSLHVFLLRQIRIEIRGKVGVQNVIIGEAQLDAVPPAMTDCYCLPVGCGDEYISWTGQLKLGKGVPTSSVNPETEVGGFHVGNHLKVNDFVALSVGNANPPWKDVGLSIGVKLVTEPWDAGSDNEMYF